MKIAVLSAAYNAEKWIEETIQSVQNQTFTNYEHIIINDGSSDNTTNIIQRLSTSDSRIRFYYQENRGAVASKNRAFSLISDDITHIALLDHDDTWEPDCLEKLANTIYNNANIFASHGCARYIDAQGKPFHLGEMEAMSLNRHSWDKHLNRWPIESPTTYEMLCFKTCIPASAIMINRKVCDKIIDIYGYLFDPNLFPCDDWDIFMRLSLLSPIAFIPEVVLNYRWHGANYSTSEEKMRHGRHKIFVKYRQLSQLTAQQRFLFFRVRPEVSKYEGRCSFKNSINAFKEKKYYKASRYYMHSCICNMRALQLYIYSDWKKSVNTP